MGGEKLEREITGKMPTMKDEDLLRIIRRSGKLGLEASKEFLKRLTKKTFSPEQERTYLLEILESLKPSWPKDEKEVSELKNQVADIIIEKGLLTERALIIILREIDSQSKLTKAVRRYHSQAKAIPNYVLLDIVRKVNSEKQWAAETVLSQNPTTDDLLVLEEELGGLLQREVFEKHRKKGISIEDGEYIIEMIPPLAEVAWQEIYPKIARGKPQSQAEHYYEFSKYTDSPEVKRDISNKMWIIREDLTREQLNHLEQNAGLVTIEDPEKVRNWINQHFLRSPISFDEALEVKERTKSNIIRKEAIKEAIKKGKKEIRKIERELKKEEKQERYWPGPTWKKNRLEFLRNKVLELERELENLEREKEIEESALKGGDNMEVSTLVQT